MYLIGAEMMQHTTECLQKTGNSFDYHAMHLDYGTLLKKPELDQLYSQNKELQRAITRYVKFQQRGIQP